MATFVCANGVSGATGAVFDNRMRPIISTRRPNCQPEGCELDSEEELPEPVVPPLGLMVGSVSSPCLTLMSWFRSLSCTDAIEYTFLCLWPPTLAKAGMTLLLEKVGSRTSEEGFAGRESLGAFSECATDATPSVASDNPAAIRQTRE